MVATVPAPREQFAPGIEALIDEAIANYKVPLAPMNNTAASLETKPTGPAPEEDPVAPDASRSPSKRPREDETDKCSKKPKSFTMLDAEEARCLRGSSAFMALKDEFMTCDMHSYLAYMAAKSQSTRNQPLDTHMCEQVFRKMQFVIAFMETLDKQD
tara:strand:+ start:3783 stop:4253 length:471 start_codon:yes stop_codon:yes gene_type:complete